MQKGYLALGLAAAAMLFAVEPAAAQQGAGDLLVAPTRLELDGLRGTEVVLNNIGSEPATYRISLELRRMTADGGLVDVDPANASDAEKTALEMIAYAPRRVTLQPNQPQQIRVGVRPPAELPDGEYRVHMLFRAIPDPRPATADPGPSDGIAIELRPIYGVTIPVIVRAGQVSAQAGISNAHLITRDGRQGVSFDLSRTGNRSLYGDVRLVRPGSDPIVLSRGIAIYAEIDHRTVALPAPEGFTGSLAGPAKLQYVQRSDDGDARVLAEAEVTLR
jgi:hypothetical protein